VAGQLYISSTLATHYQHITCSEATIKWLENSTSPSSTAICRKFSKVKVGTAKKNWVQQKKKRVQKKNSEKSRWVGLTTTRFSSTIYLRVSDDLTSWLESYIPLKYRLRRVDLRHTPNIGCITTTF
jgi:hypothetical protein